MQETRRYSIAPRRKTARAERFTGEGTLLAQLTSKPNGAVRNVPKRAKRGPL
jgi:hypothetical protein